MLLNACLGMAFALCARDRVRADGPFAAPAFPIVLVFVGVVILPSALYLYTAHSAWNWLYLVDPTKVPGLALVPVLFIQGAIAIAGWYLASHLIITNRMRPLYGALGGTAAALLVMFAVGWSRLERYGTYEAFQRGETRGLLEVKLGYVLIALVLGASAAAGYVCVELVRDGRRVRAR